LNEKIDQFIQGKTNKCIKYQIEINRVTRKQEQQNT